MKLVNEFVSLAFPTLPSSETGQVASRMKAELLSHWIICAFNRRYRCGTKVELDKATSWIRSRRAKYTRHLGVSSNNDGKVNTSDDHALENTIIKAKNGKKQKAQPDNGKGSKLKQPKISEVLRAKKR